MGMSIDEYIEMKLQQKRFSKTIDTLWIMAQKYQKIEQIVKTWDDDENTMILADKIREVIEDGNDDCN